MHLSMENQLSLKKQMLIEVFADFGLTIEPELVPSPKITNFRYRTQLKCSEGIVGFSARNSNTIVEIANCKILSEGILSNLDRIRKLGRINCEFSLLESSSSGEVGLSVYEKKKYVTIPGFPEKVSENYGYGEISLRSNTFAQSNPFVTSLIIQDLMQQIKPGVTIHELYCGCGTFSIPMAKVVNRLIGYELNQKSVLAAEQNAELNSLENTKFISVNLEKPIRLGKPDIIVADPPRKGLNNPLIESIHNTKTDTFLYVSCNPSTLARDAAALQKTGGFLLEKLTAYDMYCHSTHLELLAVFHR